MQGTLKRKAMTPAVLTALRLNRWKGRKGRTKKGILPEHEDWDTTGTALRLFLPKYFLARNEGYFGLGAT